MDSDQLPPIDQALLDALDKLFPERSPTINETIDGLMYRGGQRSVIRFLHEQFARQNENITERPILNVYAQSTENP